MQVAASGVEALELAREHMPPGYAAAYDVRLGLAEGQKAAALTKQLGVTSVVISHDIASAFNIADQIVFVYEGQIVASGLQADMLASEHPFVRKFFATWREKNT